MKKFTSLLVGLLVTTLTHWASAQVIPLDNLLKLGALPAGLPYEKLTAAMLTSEWIYQGPVEKTEEVYWTAGETRVNSSNTDLHYESWLSLRPMPGGSVDVLFKTEFAQNYDPLRKELKRLKLPVKPVNCPECEGERYEGPGYTITLYSGKKGPYPFVVVLHQAPAPTPLPISAPSLIPTESLPAVQPASAANHLPSSQP